MTYASWFSTVRPHHTAGPSGYWRARASWCGATYGPVQQQREGTSERSLWRVLYGVVLMVVVAAELVSIVL